MTNQAIRRFLFSFILIFFCLSRSEAWGQVCVQAGSGQTQQLSTILAGALGTCANNGPFTYNITSSTVSGVAISNGAMSISPTSGGIVTVAIINNQSNVCHTVNINVINTAFSTSGNQCHQLTITPPSGNSSGVTYQYTLDGNVIHTSGSAFNHQFETGGNVQITLTASLGSCSFIQTISANVPGPNALLTFQGDTYLESTPNTTWVDLSDASYLAHDTTLLRYCLNFVYGAGIMHFPLRFSDASSNASGITNYTVSFDNTIVYNSSVSPSMIEITNPSIPATQGYHELIYTITSSGCTATRVYTIYIAEEMDNMSVGLTQTPGQSTCIGNAIAFSIPPEVYDFPPGTEIKLVVSCDVGFSEEPTNPVYTIVWPDPDSVPNPIVWTPSAGSCNCHLNRYKLYTYASNPCSSQPANTTTVAINDAIADFDYNPIYCIGTQNFQWLALNSCATSHGWTLTNPTGVQTSLGTSSSTNVSANFNVSGSWQLTHTVSSNCGPDTFTADICIADVPSGTISMDGGYVSGQSICMTNPSYTLNPSFAMDGGLDFCGLTPQYNWSVAATNTNGCVSTSPCFSIQSGTQNSASPVIVLNCSGTFVITCSVSLPGLPPGQQCASTPVSFTITLVSPPQFNMPSIGNCLTACMGNDWSPSGCITISACNGGALSSSGFSYNGSSYAWNDSLSVSSLASFPVTLNAATTVNGSACSNTQTYTVTVIPPPDPQISGPNEVCPSVPFDLTVANGCGGQWSIVGGGNIANPTGLSINASTQFQYICSASGCSGGDTLEVVVPLPPAVVIQAPATPPCVGGSVTFHASVNPTNPSYTYQWSENGNNSSVNPTYTLSPSNGSLIGLEVGYGPNNACVVSAPSYTVAMATVNVQLNCSSIPSPVCMNMDPLSIPDIVLMTSGLTLDSIILNNTPIAPDALIQPSVLGAGTHIIRYYYQNDNGCSFMDSCVFEVVAPTVVSINAQPTMCEGATQLLSFSPTVSAGTINWTSTPCVGCISASGISAAFSPTSIDSYTIALSGDCIEPTQATIDVTPNPTGAITVPANMCVTENIPLTGTSNPANATVTWSVNGQTIDSPFNASQLGVGAGTHQLCMNISDQNNCVAQLCQDITVSNASTPFPTVTCIPTFDYFCFDMPCESVPNPTIPAAWTLTGKTWNGEPFSDTQICAGQGIFTAGDHELTYSFVDNVGCPMPITCDIHIHDVTQVNITYPGSPVICESETIQFGTSVNTVPYGQWSCIECPTCINSDGLFTSPDIQTQTTYTIVYDDFCVNQTSISITVNPNPEVTAQPVAGLCINEEVTLNGSLSNDVVSSLWRWNNVDLPSNLLDPDAIGMTAGSTYQICHYGTNAYGCADQDCFPLQIIGLPGQIVIDNDALHCLSQSFTLPVNNVVDYSVTFIHASTQQSMGPIQEGQTITFTQSGLYNYVIVIASNAGCEITQSGQLNVLNNPVAEIGISDYNMCAPEFDILNLSTGDDVTYQWSSDLPITNLTAALPTPSHHVVAITPTDQVYQISLTVSNFCHTSTDVVTVNFVAPPVADIDIISPLGNFNCAVFCVDLQATSASTSNISEVIYAWPGYQTTSGQTNLHATNLNPVSSLCFDTYSAETITIEVAIYNLCGSDVADVSFDIVPPQVSAEFNIQDFMCPGQSMEVVDMSFPQGGATVTYVITPEGQGVYYSDGYVMSLPTAVPGTYTLTQHVTGCGSDIEQHTFTIGSLPSIELLPVSGSHCAGEVVELFAITDQSTEPLIWDFGDGESLLAYTTVQHVYSAPGVYAVTATTGLSATCSNSATIFVDISGGEYRIVLTDSVICSGTEITAKVLGQWDNIEWKLLGESIENWSGVSELQLNFLNQGEFTKNYVLEMRAYNLSGCPSVDVRMIHVKPQPAISWSIDNLCNQLPGKGVIRIYPNRSNWQYIYDIPGAMNIQRDDSSDSLKIEALFFSAQQVDIKVRNNFGCSTTAHLGMGCNEEPIYVPNSFTPDDDGLNDAFKPIFVVNPKKYEFVIYNHWGEKVFESSDPDEYWIGDHRGNATHFVPDGVYNWLLQYDFLGGQQKMLKKRGHVTIIR